MTMKQKKTNGVLILSRHKITSFACLRVKEKCCVFPALIVTFLFKSENTFVFATGQVLPPIA